MTEKAIKLVREYIASYTDKEPTLFVVWQAKVLQNFKCLIATTLPHGMYFELTYNGDEKTWYMDVYRKTENMEIADV